MRTTPRWFSYTMSSVITTVVNILLMLALLRLGFPSWLANATALVLEVPLAYHLARRYVWGDRPPTSLKRDIVVFYCIYLTNLLAASVVLYLTNPQTPTLVLVVQAGVFFVLWVLEFFFLDRVLLAHRYSR